MTRACRAQFTPYPPAIPTPPHLRRAVQLHAIRMARTLPAYGPRMRLDIARALVWAGWQYASDRGCGHCAHTPGVVPGSNR